MKFGLITISLMITGMTAHAWEVDFSHHRQVPAQSQASAKTPGATEKVMPSTPVEASDDDKSGLPPQRPKSLDGFVEHSRPPAWTGDRQEFVILNTGKGFVPSNVRVHKGAHYIVHVVNVNEDKKNVSFMLDAFNQHYATYFGEIKSFNLDPDKEGVFDFECPETASLGKLVVFGGNNTMPPARTLSSTPETSK